MFTSENNPGKGRPVGVGNKTTTQIKEAYQKLLEDNLDNMTLWLGKIAEKDPARATELMLKLSEYILPKLARQEVVGNDGEDLFKNVSFTFSTADKENQNGKED
jgi:hypothetical protein